MGVFDLGRPRVRGRPFIRRCAGQLQPQSPHPLPQQAEPSALASVSQGQHSCAAPAAEVAAVAAPAPGPHDDPVPQEDPLSQHALAAVLLAFARAACVA